MVANKILAGEARQEMVWERLLGKEEGREWVGNDGEHQGMEGEVLGPGKICGEEMTSKWTNQGGTALLILAGIFTI